jgi:hypothetical protein
MSEATDNLKKLLEETSFTQLSRLTFSERCGAFFALQTGYSQKVIARAFGVHSSTASLIAHCLTSKDTRYASIAAEFHKLGLEEFGEKYFTPAMFDAIALARRNIPNDKRRSGPSRTPSNLPGFHWIDGGIIELCIDSDEWITRSPGEAFTTHARTPAAALKAYYRYIALEMPDPHPAGRTWAEINQQISPNHP